jgi:hypothetical protein
VEIFKRIDHSEDLGIYGSIILKLILENRVEICDWIHLVQDRDQWNALVNRVISLRVSQKAGNFLTS